VFSLIESRASAPNACEDQKTDKRSSSTLELVDSGLRWEAIENRWVTRSGSSIVHRTARNRFTPKKNLRQARSVFLAKVEYTQKIRLVRPADTYCFRHQPA